MKKKVQFVEMPVEMLMERAAKIRMVRLETSLEKEAVIIRSSQLRIKIEVAGVCVSGGLEVQRANARPFCRLRIVMMMMMLVVVVLVLGILAILRTGRADLDLFLGQHRKEQLQDQVVEKRDVVVLGEK